MGYSIWRQCLLISTFIYAFNTQKIGYFNLEIGEGTCLAPGNVRELDPLYFFADLHFNTSLSMHDWFYFAVYAIDKLRRTTRLKVGDLLLTKCMDKEMLAHFHQSPQAGCVYMGVDRIFMGILVLANKKHSGKDYYGQWHSIDKGFIRSNYEAGPIITTREFETLTINNVSVPLKLDITQLNLDKTKLMRIQYCVLNLNNHTTAVRVGRELFTTTSDCVQTVANAIGLDEIHVGYEEHEGSCKSTVWRILMLYHVKPSNVHSQGPLPGQFLVPHF